MAAYYKLVVKEGGQAVLHNDPGQEECNLDDTDADVRIDDLTARGMVNRKEIRRCEHCEKAAPFAAEG